MMNIRSSITAAAVLAIGLFATGCAAGLVPFTQELRDQNRLTDEEIKNLQFYVSHKITLRRELESGGRQVTGSHKLLLTSGKSIEEVVVEDKTPGVAVGVKGVVISLSFEPGSSLDFVVEGGKPTGTTDLTPVARNPDPFPGNARPPELIQNQAPAPSSFSGNYWLWVEPTGQVAFQNQPFDAVEDSNQAYLMIDADTLKEVVKKRKVLKGILLPTR